VALGGVVDERLIAEEQRVVALAGGHAHLGRRQLGRHLGEPVGQWAECARLVARAELAIAGDYQRGPVLALLADELDLDAHEDVAAG